MFLKSRNAMAGYSKEFLIAAFISRYVSLPEESFTSLIDMAYDFYDKVGRDEFRRFCSLDAQAIKDYKTAEKIQT